MAKKAKQEAPRRANGIKTKRNNMIWNKSEVRKQWKEYFWKGMLDIYQIVELKLMV